MAPHFSTLAWKIPWMEEPGRLQSIGLQRVRHTHTQKTNKQTNKQKKESDKTGATSLSLFTFMHWRRKWQPTPVFLPGESQGQGSLENPRDSGAWWAAVYGVAQSLTRLKRLSSSSSKKINIQLQSRNTENLIINFDIVILIWKVKQWYFSKQHKNCKGKHQRET